MFHNSSLDKILVLISEIKKSKNSERSCSYVCYICVSKYKGRLVVKFAMPCSSSLPLSPQIYTLLLSFNFSWTFWRKLAPEQRILLQPTWFPKKKTRNYQALDCRCKFKVEWIRSHDGTQLFYCSATILFFANYPNTYNTSHAVLVFQTQFFVKGQKRCKRKISDELQ